MSEPMDLTVYLSGEIHTDWRQQILEACTSDGLNIDFLEPVIDLQNGSQFRQNRSQFRQNGS